MKKNRTDFDFNAPMNKFMRGVMRTLVKQEDFRGIGGHGLKDHGTHGPHSQVSIGTGNSTTNFRFKPSKRFR